MAAVHFGEQLADLFRRILQVGVQSHDALAPAAFESGHDRHVLPVIAVEQHHAGHVRPLLELRPQQRRGAIAAAVIDEDDFVARIEPVQGGIEPVEQRLQARLLVVDRDHDRDLRRAHARVASRSTSLRVAHTRSTSSSESPGWSGSETVSQAMRSVWGKFPGW